MLAATNKKKVLIVGDVMLDRYVIADEIRKSPEADIPLVYNYHFEDRLGGAANVAINLKSLEIEPILFGIIGNDDHAEQLESLCQMHGLQHYFLTDSPRPTTLKSRVVDSAFNQLFRMDLEVTNDIDPELEQSVKEALNSIMAELVPDAIIIQDYNKGLLTDSMIQYLQEKSNQLEIPLLVDPKSNNFNLLTTSTVFKPNLKELSAAVGYNIEPNDAAISEALDKLGGHEEAIYIVTLAEHGIYYRSKAESAVIPGYEVENADVSGAGDTVLAVLTYGLLQGLDPKAMASLGNLAGSIVCGKKGIHPIYLEELVSE